MDHGEYTIAGAARVLGTSDGAIRQRIKRKTLRSVKRGGRVYVLLDGTEHVGMPSGTGESDALTSEREERIADLRAHIADLRAQLEAERSGHEQTRQLLGGALARIELPSSEPSDVYASDAATEERAADASDATPEHTRDPRPWWRRIWR